MPIVIAQQRISEERGVSLLESSLCFVLFCGLLLMGSGLWNYVDVNNGLTRIAEHYANGTSLGAFQYQPAVDRYEINLTKIRDEFKNKLSIQALKEMSAEVNTEDRDQIRIDFAITTLSVDTTNGSPGLLKSINDADIISVGGSSVPAFLTDHNFDNGEADMNSAVAAYVANVSSSIAIPTQSFGVSGSRELYLPEVPIIVVRTVYNYRNAGILKGLGILDEPYGWDLKVAALRGEVG